MTAPVKAHAAIETYLSIDANQLAVTITEIDEDTVGFEDDANGAIVMLDRGQWETLGSPGAVIVTAAALRLVDSAQRPLVERAPALTRFRKWLERRFRIVSASAAVTESRG